MRLYRSVTFIVISWFIIIGMTAGNSMADQIRPAMTPKEIRSLTSYNFSILSAKIVPATDKIPEHCDIRGLILPEVRFAVKLPTKWNGRFYMVRAITK